MAANYVIWFENLRMTDVESVGGKNASSGEMISQLTEKGVRVPGGFATTAEAYRAFLAHNGLAERISRSAGRFGCGRCYRVGTRGQRNPPMDFSTPLPEQLDADIKTAWDKMVADAGSETSPWPCALQPPPKICPMLLLPASKKPSSISTAWKMLKKR